MALKCNKSCSVETFFCLYGGGVNPPRPNVIGHLLLLSYIHFVIMKGSKIEYLCPKQKLIVAPVKIEIFNCFVFYNFLELT